MDPKTAFINNKGIATLSLCEFTQEVTEGIKATINPPCDIDLGDIWIETYNSPTNATLVVDIKENNISILDRYLTIDIGEKNSKTSTIGAKLKQYTLSKGKTYTFEVISTDTTNPCKGLNFLMECYPYIENTIYNFLSFVTGSSISTDIGGKGIVIGTIDYNDLNSASSGVSSIDIVFSETKPANKYLSDVFFKNTEEFTTYGYVSNTITSISKKADIVVISNASTSFPKIGLDDITIHLTLEGNNNKNWTGGSVTVFGIFKNYPTI
jgi:hypothetical protein